MSFYSPIDRLAQTLPRPKGTGAEFMTELSKMPGYKSQEAEDRGLQALMNLPKMERAQFMEALKAKQPVVPETGVLQTPHHKEYTLPGGSNYREILLKHPQGEFKGVGHHFGGEPNILASVRAKDRLGPNGEKILHIEELQSDWHQRGREHGYKKSTGSADSTGWKVVYPYPHDPDEIAIVDKDGKEIWSGYNNYYTEKEAIDHVASYINEDEYADEHKVPDAPFKKNWHEMALKKMIHHAAKNGYDAIAITPGAEQAERYGLAKHIGMVSYNPMDQRFQAFKPNRETVINEKGATPQRVAELIGKDAAERLMKAPKAGDHHFLEGEDLNIGGEGMKGFYDKIVPNFLNQFGKKYGAKVGTKPLTIEGGIEPGWVTKPAAPREVPVHHFPITPAMREDVVKNGVPLYAEGGSTSRKEHDANLAKFLKGSKAKERAYHGTGSLETLAAFDPSMTGKGLDQYGSGFYFTSNPQVASNYAPEPGATYTNKVGGAGSPGVVAAHLAIRKPIRLGVNAQSLADAPVHLSHAEAQQIIQHAPNLHDVGETPLRNFYDVSAGVTPQHVNAVAKNYIGRGMLHALENDMFPNAPTEFRHALHNVLGYDSVVKKNKSGDTHYVAWFPEQIKSAIGNRGTYDPNDPDITKAKGGAVKPIGYTKEQVTVSPNLDAMRYELESVKHYTKKVK